MSARAQEREAGGNARRPPRQRLSPRPFHASLPPRRPPRHFPTRKGSVCPCKDFLSHGCKHGFVFHRPTLEAAQTSISRARTHQPCCVRATAAGGMRADAREARRRLTIVILGKGAKRKVYTMLPFMENSIKCKADQVTGAWEEGRRAGTGEGTARRASRALPGTGPPPPPPGSGPWDCAPQACALREPHTSTGPVGTAKRQMTNWEEVLS